MRDVTIRKTSDRKGSVGLELIKASCNKRKIDVLLGIITRALVAAAGFESVGA